MNDIPATVPSGNLPTEPLLTPPNVNKTPQAAERTLRLWPAIIIIALQWLVVLGAGWLAPGTMIQFLTGFLAPVIGTLIFTAWWLFASRLPWTDRFIILLLCIVIGIPVIMFRDPSFSGMGLISLFLYALPVVTTAWVLWLLATRSLRWPIRRSGLLIIFALGFGYFSLLRFDGTDGSMTASMPYRWTPTAEEALMKFHKETHGQPAPAVDPTQALILQPGDWPGFRGPNRDNRFTGMRIATDWEKNPPRCLWRHPVGPGWSSFAVIGTHLYTQEQRGPDEAVVCYQTTTGAELWVHQDAARFMEAIGGPGPRATPTFHEGKIYALGAAGKLNCLDALTGKVIWSRDIVEDSKAKVPIWGFAASPLVAQGVVTVFAGGPQGKSVLGYKADSGEPAWSAGNGQLSYASLHPARLGASEQVVLMSELGLTAFNPVNGAILWEHAWQLEGGMGRIVQPALIGDAGILIGTGFGMGTRRLEVHRQEDKWEVKEAWTSGAIKPYFNDLVVHKGYLYGFDGNYFTCVNLENGKGQWRERGYGNGQVLLLADQDILLILSETGEAALVATKPDGYKELGRIQALDGKTWNHPVISHGLLFVRNGAEAACYQLTEEKSQLSSR